MNLLLGVVCQKSAATALALLPSLDACTLANSDLLQKVENLENEIKELKKCRNEEGMLAATLARLVEQVKKVEQLLPQQESGLKDNSSEKSPKESASKGARRARSGLKNRQRHGTANGSVGRRVTNDSSLVKIGEGVTFKKKQLEKLWKLPNLTATKFVRQLCLAVFTPQELQGKCLKQTGPSDNREVLDPLRLNAIVDFTCANFGANRSRLRMVISYMLRRLNEGYALRSHW
ncbi:uncharacterized protein LOC119403385 [Rhipicephalus sanguineus]|uniref:uncharacterized protein LOC119403385 n=1 Tax=Rhipicephalus sanguineus TaxID=34632 RepID=UPI001896247D|nr:uncharacterized protein LOC119403385 [Rhipicephalus sanguineus]